MSHDPDNIHLPEMPLPRGLPPDDFPCCRQHPTEPTYTAAEVKVLTETASKVAYTLGRKDALDEMTSKCEEGAENLAAEAAGRSGHASWKLIGTSRGYKLSAEVARNLASQAPQDASDATSGVPGHQEVSEAVRSPQEPAICRRCFHTAHDDVGECRVCYCRSATKGNTP